MKKITLTKGVEALVDDSDYKYLSQWKWCVDSKGYAVRSERRSETGRKSRRMIMMHREILNTPDYVDHINGLKHDNRRANLRVATSSENMRNRKVAYNNKCGFKGVWFNSKKNRWVSYLKLQQTRVIAHTKTAEEAAYIYDQVALQVFGEYARTNII